MDDNVEINVAVEQFEMDLYSNLWTDEIYWNIKDLKIKLQKDLKINKSQEVKEYIKLFIKQLDK